MSKRRAKRRPSEPVHAANPAESARRWGVDEEAVRLMASAANVLTPIYALYVLNERRAAEEMAEAGFEVWNPTYLKRLPPRMRSRYRLATLTEAPLFPGYIFARIPPGRFHHAKACERVIGVVSISEQPLPVPQKEFADVIIAIMAGRLNEALPLTRARPRGNRTRVSAALVEWFEAAGRASRGVKRAA